jgi:cytidine deaminase
VGFNFTDQAAGASRLVVPCGSCRQLIAEAAQRGNGSVRVICCNGDLSSIAVWMIGELLPNAFGPENLAVGRQWPALREELHACVERLIAIRKKP